MNPKNRKLGQLSLQMSPTNRDIFPPSIIRVWVNQNGSVTFMNIGYLKNHDGESSKYLTIKTNTRFFKHSRVYSNLLKLANVGEFYWS